MKMKPFVFLFLCIIFPWLCGILNICGDDPPNWILFPWSWMLFSAFVSLLYEDMESDSTTWPIAIAGWILWPFCLVFNIYENSLFRKIQKSDCSRSM